MAIGGFNGGDPAPTLAQFQAYVAGRRHPLLHRRRPGRRPGWRGGFGGGAPPSGGFGGGNGGGGGRQNGSSSEIAAWVAANYTATTVGGATVYDLTATAPGRGTTGTPAGAGSLPVPAERRYHDRGIRSGGSRVKIIVLGAGVVGVTSAYYLAQDGHEVVVVDREGEVGQDASAGNAGLIAPGHSYAWASPAAPKLMLGSLAGKKTSIRVKPRLDPDARRLGRPVPARVHRRSRPAQHAREAPPVPLQPRPDQVDRRDREHRLRGREAGMFYLYADEAELEAGFQKTALLRENGEDLQLLDAAGVVEREPVLAHLRDAAWPAPSSAPPTPAATARSSRRASPNAAARSASTSSSGAPINGLRESGGTITAVQTTNGDIVGDGYVLALGVGSAGSRRSVGLRVPVYPGQGLLGHVPGARGRRVPAGRRRRREHAGRLVAARRLAAHVLDRRVRGLRPELDEADFAGVLETARRLFPTAAHYDRGRYRACLRPMTPDGPPLIGPSKLRNLWFNTGHGHMGWTMGPGSGKLVADVIGRRAPEIDMAGMQAR